MIRTLPALATVLVLAALARPAEASCDLACASAACPAGKVGVYRASLTGSGALVIDSHLGRDTIAGADPGVTFDLDDQVATAAEYVVMLEPHQDAEPGFLALHAFPLRDGAVTCGEYYAPDRDAAVALDDFVDAAAGETCQADLAVAGIASPGPCDDTCSAAGGHGAASWLVLAIAAALGLGRRRRALARRP